MWWLVPIAIIGVGKVVYEVFSNEGAEKEKPKQKSVLELNFDRLGRELHCRGGMKVAILGQAGAGKSLLLKKMTGGEVVPPPFTCVQTDATNWSEDSGCSLLSFYKEIIFVDVPGYDTKLHPVDTFLQYFPWNKFDAFIFVFHGKLHQGDEYIYKKIAQQKKKYFIARSFSESLDELERNQIKIDLRCRLYLRGKKVVYFFSNRTSEGVSEIWKRITNTT